MPLFLSGSLTALLVVGALALVLRWAFGGRTDRGWSPEDFGLLTTITTVDDPATAAGVRRTLREAGIRSTVAVTRDARVSVLVFESESDQAKRLVS